MQQARESRVDTCILDASRGLQEESRSLKMAGQLIDAVKYITGAHELLDTALDMTPGVSWAKDCVEALSGRSIVTGERLSTFERSAALIGSVTVGFSSKFLKGFNAITKYFRGNSAVIKHTQGVLNSIKGWGLSNKKLGYYIGELKKAAKTKGNFTMPKSTKKEASFLGEAWVGKNAKVRPYGGQPRKFIYISQDGTKAFREPVRKGFSGKEQANFQWKHSASDKK